MNERVDEPVDLVGTVGLAGNRSVDANESGAPRAEENEDQEELLDYLAVQPRSSQKLRVEFRHGARPQPLPHPLDEGSP
jgi:hypothetical protein